MIVFIGIYSNNLQKKCIDKKLFEFLMIIRKKNYNNKKVFSTSSYFDSYYSVFPGNHKKCIMYL